MNLLSPPEGLWEKDVQFVLASASPARLTTLRNAGVEPLVRVSEVDEDAVLAGLLREQPDAGPGTQVQALADAKATDVLARLNAAAHAWRGNGQQGSSPANSAPVDGAGTESCPAPTGAVPNGLDLTAPTLIVGCDSMLEINGQVVGKPANAHEALARLRALSGGSGILHTGHCVYFAPAGLSDPAATTSGALLKAAGATSATTVHFAKLTEAEIEAYVASGEPLRVAGAFTIDGLGGPFVTGIEGDHHGVIGISLPLLRTLLLRVSVPWPALWKSSRQTGQ